MKPLTCILFAVAALVAADVSHLEMSPDQAAASNTHDHYESAPNSFDTPSDSADSSGPEGAASFSSNQYSAVAAAAAPDTSSESDVDFEAPQAAAASFNSFQTAEYQGPVLSSFKSSFTVPEGAASVAHFKSVLPAPAVRTFDVDSNYFASEEAASFSAPQTVDFNAESEAFPFAFNSFMDSSYSAPLGSASEVDTHYAIDGGYVY